ncbi:MAG: radical SAM protein [Halodesulfurarchaeum sp.]
MISEGCEQCAIGGKLVLFVHGFCDRRDCFYCPLGENRKNVDTVFANERPVERDEDVLEEARKMDAIGSSITGGEPLESMDRTTHYIRLLKDEFGEDHHIHLYTGITGDRETMRDLAEAGLDEIRFHPPIGLWGNLHGTDWEDILHVAREEGLTPAFEIPGIEAEPEFLEFIEEGAAEFVNVNEFELSQGNYRRMHDQGYTRRENHMSAVDGKDEGDLAELVAHPKVYFCTSTFKDAAQHRNRLRRTAENVRRPFEEQTDDGTLVYGVTDVDPSRLEELGVPEEFYEVTEKRIEMAWWLLDEMVEEGDVESGAVIEQYPTWDGQVVERTPLG